MQNILVNIQIDCESTQRSIGNPALGLRALQGIADCLERSQMKGTFCVIPSDIVIHKSKYLELLDQGHEIGLHVHPSEQGYQEFLGVHSVEQQYEIIAEAKDVFEQTMSFSPETFTPGYASANDNTFSVLESLQFRQGFVSIPTRTLSQCASVWAGSPLDVHYAHRYYRSLVGDVNFVDVPLTVDPDSRMWGGDHPQDLRVELTDAKNHYYTILKTVQRQLDSEKPTPIKYIKMLTHNIFEYDNPANFRRETLLDMIEATRRICASEECTLQPATTKDIAEKYRQTFPLSAQTHNAELTLDTRSRKCQK